jgi:hypothetical protein
MVSFEVGTLGFLLAYEMTFNSVVKQLNPKSLIGLQ